MAAPRLKVGGLDLSPYLRTQPDESPAMDPAAMGYFEPQMSGAPALGEGSTWVGDAVNNRTMVFPLYFTASNRAEIYKLIRETDQALVKGAQVEFNLDPDVDQSSFFDLERGKFEQTYNVYHLINTVAGGVLTLFVRPYANTATHRLIASIPAATSAVVKFAATGIMGDAYALANLEVRVGSAVASAGRVIVWGMHPHPSHNPYRAATSGLAQTGATVRGASGAIGSQYTAIPVSPTGASGIAYTAYLDPPSAHVGRHRVIAIGRSALYPPISLYAEDRFGAILGATALASQTDVNKWQFIDLGEVQVPVRASGQDAVPTQFVNIYGGGASGAVIIASPALHLNGLVFLPLDYSAGILRLPARGPANFSILDTFARIEGAPGPKLLENNPNSDTGQPWSKISGFFGFNNIGGIACIAPVNSENVGASGASAFYNLASGRLISDAEVLARIIPGASNIASGAYVEPWVKRNPGVASGGVWTRLSLGPSQTLQLFTGNGETATVIASAGIASTLASGLYAGQPHNLILRTQGGAADVYIATGPLSASPILHASHAMITAPGNPALRAQSGAATSLNGAPAIDQFEFSEVGLKEANLNASREFFRFEAHPEGRVYQGNASVFIADRLANYRGQFPKMPPVPSNSTATSAARIVVLQGELDNIQGLDGPDISLAVLERSRFLRD